MKEYKIVIHGDDNFDEPYIEVIEIEADSLKEAIREAYNQNGVWDAEPAREYNEEWENWEEDETNKI